MPETAVPSIRSPWIRPGSCRENTTVLPYVVRRALILTDGSRGRSGVKLLVAIDKQDVVKAMTPASVSRRIVFGAIASPPWIRMYRATTISSRPARVVKKMPKDHRPSPHKSRLVEPTRLQDRAITS
jgi:hypothetical protein